VKGELLNFRKKGLCHFPAFA